MSKRQSSRQIARNSSYFTRLGMEVELRRLEEKAAQIRGWLGTLPARMKAKVQGFTRGSADGVAATPAAQGRRRRRKMSAEARKRISEAQKARWAKQKETTEKTRSNASGSSATGRRSAKRIGKGGAKRGRRKMSAAARKRISAAQKKRWASRRRTA